MKSRIKPRFALQLESLEGRNAPSAGLSSSLHHVAGHHAQVEKHHGQRAGDDNLARHSGKDERAAHNVADDNLPRHGGLDDGANHNAGDDKNHNRHGRG